MVVVAVRFALYLDLMVAFGLAAFGVLSLRGAERVTVLPLRQLIVTSGVLGAMLSGLALITMAASMAGVELYDVDRASIMTLVTGTAVGAAWTVRMAALALVVLVPILGWKRPAIGLGAAASAGAVAVATLAWTGHGMMGEGVSGWVHLCADIVHLLAAGIWIGALICLLMLVVRRRHEVDVVHLTLSHRALEGFAVTGTIVVAAVVVTGLANAWMLVGPNGIRLIASTLYGQLLVAKVLVFLAMVVLAAINRFRLTPGLKSAIVQGHPGDALGPLRRSLALETSCALVVLAIVAWLGTLDPTLSAQRVAQL